MSDEREQDAAEASYQKITRAIEENLLPELVRTSETLSNFAKRARASDMRGVILSDAWIDGMAATMRHAHRRINEQSSTIDRLTTERDQALHRIEQLYASTVSQGVHDKMVDLYNRAIDERDQAREQLAKLREACASISDGLIRTATHGVENLTKRNWLIQTAQNIRAALGIESEAGE